MPVRWLPGISSSGISPRKWPTPIDGSRISAPLGRPKRCIACQMAEITIGDVKCALGVEARADSYSSSVSSSFSSLAICFHSAGGMPVESAGHRAPSGVAREDAFLFVRGVAVFPFEFL